MTEPTDFAPVVLACRATVPPIALPNGSTVIGTATVKSGPFLFSNVSITDHGNHRRIALPSGSRDRRVVFLDSQLRRDFTTACLAAFEKIADLPPATAPSVTENANEHSPAS